MRRDALLVNTSRSALLDMAALPHALADGAPAMAALDVFDEEPLPAEHPLRRLPNALLTPHLGFVAQPVFEQFAAGVVECLARGCTASRCRGRCATEQPWPCARPSTGASSRCRTSTAASTVRLR